MATINEMRQVATQIENETQVGGNTASRVGGLFNDIVNKLENNETDINIVQRVEITYKQCQIPNKYINDTNVGSALSLQSNNDYGVFYFFVRKGQSFAISSTYVAPSASRLYIFHLDEDLDIVQRYENVVVGTTTYTATEDCIVVGTLYGNDSIQYTGIQKAYLVNGKMNEVGLTGANIIQHLKDLEADIDNDITNLNTEVGSLEDEVFGTPSVSNLPLSNDGVLNANGTISLYEDWYNSDYFAVDSAKQYTYNGSIYGGGNILYYDSAKNLLGACSNIPVNYADRTNPVELNDMPSNAAYIRVSGYDISACSITESDSLRPKVENIEERIDNLIKPQGIIEPVFGATLANPVRIKLLGDSITQGWGGSNFDQDGAEIYPLGEGWQTHRNLHGYCWANMMRDYLETKYHCTVVNNAITGTSTRNIVTRLDDFIDAADDIVICAYGTNNRNNYDGNNTEWNSFVPDLFTIVNYCKERNKTIILVANIPASSANEQSTDNGHAKSAHMNDVHDAVLYVAESTGVECVDMYDAFNDYCINTNTPLGVLLGDGLHPNDNGYDVYYSLIMPSIGVAIESAAESGGVIDAGNIKYDNSQSGLVSDNVQGALDEVSHAIMNENEIFSTIPVAKIINGSNTWVVQSGMQGEFVPVVHGKNYRIVVDSSNSGVIAFMTRATTTNVYYAGGATSRTILPPSTNVVLTAPSDANYLYFTQIGSTPATVRVYEIETIQDEINNINDDINTIENAVGLKNSVINFVDFNYIINPNQLLQQTSSSWRMSTSMYKVGDDFTIIPTDQTQQYYPVGFDENFHFIRSYADDGMATGTRTFNASSFGVKYIYVAASNRNSMSIDAQAIFKRESIVCAASDTSCKDGADIICPSTDARESLQLAISYGLLTDRKVILMNGRYILNSYFTEGGGNACLIASGFTTSTGETDDQYGNRIRFTTIEGSNDVLGWADGAILKVSDTLYESVTDATPLTVIRGMVTDWQPWENASAISLKNIKVILPSNQKAITCVDFGYTDNARVKHLYCSAFDPLVTPLNVHPDDLDIPIANSECVGVKLTFGSNMDAAIYEHISVLGFYAGIDFSGDHAIVNSPTAIYCYYGFTFGKYMHSGGMTLPITIINMTEEHNVCLPIYYAGSSNTKVIQILSGNVYWPEKGCQGNIPFDDPRRVAATIPNHNYRGYINYVNGINPSTGWFDTIQSSLPTSYFAAGSEIYMEQKNMAAPPSATSTVRRTWAKGLGMQCFDTTLNKVVFCVVKNNALAWVDANGNTVDN